MSFLTDLNDSIPQITGGKAIFLGFLYEYRYFFFTFHIYDEPVKCKYIFIFNFPPPLYWHILLPNYLLYGEFVIHTHSFCLMRQDSVRKKKVQDPNTIPSINLDGVLNLEEL